MALRAQQTVWEAMHADGTAFPSWAKGDPGEPVKWFADWLVAKGANPTPVSFKRVVDLGCGQGRNAVFLAKLGFNVTAVDYIERALQRTTEFATRENVHRRVKTVKAALDEKWPFAINYFDAAVDCYSSIDIETLEGREVFRHELFRTLKPGAYALVAVVSANDEYEAELIHTHPGPEQNSGVWRNGKFQKDYDEKELREFYEEAGFRVAELKTVQKESQKMGREYTATNLWLVVQKPA